MALTKITSDVIGSGAVESTHIASGAISSSHLTGITTDNVSEGSSNTYFTNARARGAVSVTGGNLSYDSGTGVIQLTTGTIRAQLSGGTGVTYNSTSGAISIGQSVATDATPTFGNITTTGYIAGPATFTIDPAAVGDNTGTVVIAGNLQVDGTTTTVNSTTVQVSDKTIELGYDATTDAANNNAGIIVHRPETSNAYIFWNETNERFEINRKLNINRELSIDASGTNDIHVEIGSGTSDNHYAYVDLIGDSTYTDYGLRIIRNNSGANTSSVIHHRGTGALVLETLEAGDIKLRTSNTDALIVDSSQNVGIGTTSPDSLLHLHNTSQNSYIHLSGGGSLGETYGGFVRGYGVSGEGGHLELGVIDNGTKKVGIEIIEQGNGIIFDTAATESMRIDSLGRVGINQNSPVALLHIGDSTNSLGTTAGDQLSVLRLQSDTANTDSLLFTTERLANGTTWTTAAHRIQRKVDTTLMGYMQFGSNSDDLITFGEGETEYMRIDGSGNVGIGTNGAEKRLHITDSTQTNQTIRFGNPSATPYGEINYNSSGFEHLYITSKGTTTGYGNIVFNTGGTPSEAMRIDASGNVGIGESSPSFTSLSGSTSVKGLEIFNEGNDTSAALKVAACNNTGTPGQKTNFEIIHKGDALRTHLRHADSDVMVIGPDGDIHLNPNDGDFRLRGGSYGSLLDSNINNNSNLRFEASVGLLYNTGRSDGQHQFEVNGTQKFVVTPNYIQQTMTGSDQYTIRSVSNGTGDPGISFVRAGQCGFGITVRNATVDYADFQMQAGGGTVYGQEGEFRIYENGQINMGDMAGYNAGVGQLFTTTGGIYVTRNSSGSGNETFIVNNLNSANSIGILQYRLNSSPQGQYLVGSSSGITFAGSSDYRYKTNVNTLTTSSLDKISQLRLVSYNWNADSGMPVDEPQIGIIAHEMNNVFPEFVEGEYDAVWTQEEVEAKGEAAEASAGDIKPQTVSLLNKDMMVHVLKAMQELKAKNDALEARITELEG